MSRTFNLNKTSVKKLDKWIDSLRENDYTINDFNDFAERIRETIKFDVRHIKECAENVIVSYYIEETGKLLESGIDADEGFFMVLKNNVRHRLADKYTSKKIYDNTIDIYFNDVKREYILNPQAESADLEFLPENRDIFIKNNLKLVVDCAKRYRNLGLSFEDLIQAGNYGLLTAFDKYDKNRANLRFAVIKEIKNSPLEEFSSEDAEEVIRKAFIYSKNLDSTLERIPDEGFINKQEFIDWVHENIKTAVFASVAFQWVRAYILLELNKNGKIIRVPKSVKQLNESEFGDDDDENPITIINLDGLNPHTDDCYHDNQISEYANDEFAEEDESIENMERVMTFRDIVSKMLYKLSATDARIIKKRFGIGLPYQLSVGEIAESEGISTNKVKYSITNTLKFIASNISERDKETIVEMLQ